MRSPWWRTGQHPSHRVSLQREGSTPRRLLTALRVCEKHPVASWMININSLCFLQRLHSERQSCSSVCRPQLCLATRHGPQGEERRRDTVVPSLRGFPQQWQVIDFINHILRCGGWGRKNGGNDVYPCCSLRNSRLSESSETESDVLKVNSRSEELLPTPVSSTSTDSSFGEGRRRRRCTFSDCFLLPFTQISCPRASKRQSVSCTRSFCNQRSSENCQIIGAKEKKMQTSCCECITASPKYFYKVLTVFEYSSVTWI